MTKSDFTTCLDRVTVSSIQKQKMLSVILDSKKGVIVPMKRTTKRLSLTAAVIAICVLTTTTALAIGFNWNEKLMEYLNPSESQMETLSGAVNMPEATITQNGVTITVKQTLADAFGIYVLYEMTVPDNVELDNSIGWRMEVVDVPTVTTDEYITASSGGSEILEQTGNKRTVLYNLDTTAGLKDGDIKLTLKDLIRYATNDATGSTEITPVVEGEWDLKWEFSFVDTSKTVEVNEPLSINGSDDTITKIVISPMSVCAYVKGDDILMCVHPVINFKDGCRIAYDVNSRNKSFMYYLIDEANMLYQNQLYYRFENIINPDDVQSITIGDVTIPIS